jgi:hypothetical protein
MIVSLVLSTKSFVVIVVIIMIRTLAPTQSRDQTSVEVTKLGQLVAVHFDVELTSYDET